MKLDRLVSRHRGMGRKRARGEIMGGRVLVDGGVEVRHDREVSRFERVECEGELVQAGERRIYLMVNKPVGVLSATKDDEHQTVVDLIDDPDRDCLHLVGRLDRSTSGMVLLTNDGMWSKALMAPEKHVKKVYWVRTRDEIPSSAVEEFAKGFYFHTEGIVTLPAELEIVEDRLARLTLYEGKYHQIKRMFHRIGNLVVGLHRVQIGEYVMPDELGVGEWMVIDPHLGWS